MLARRSLTLGGLAALGMTAAGCATRTPARLEADGSYCRRLGRRPRQKVACTPGSVPPASADADAKRFEAIPGALGLYVLRHRWLDAHRVVELQVDGRPVAATVPASLVRVALAPGRHSLAVEWDGQRTELSIEGAPGDVHAIELVGSSWFWGDRFVWQPSTVDDLRRRAAGTRLVADVSLR